MTNVDIIKMCNNIAKDFPFALSEVYGFMATVEYFSVVAFMIGVF